MIDLNPIGLHRVRVLDIVAPNERRVADLEAFDATPIIDLEQCSIGRSNGSGGKDGPIFRGHVSGSEGIDVGNR